MLRRLPRLEVLDGGLGAEKIRLGLRHASPIIVILDLDQQVALFDALEVVDPDAAHIAFDLGAERRDVAANIGVVRDLPDRQAHPGRKARRALPVHRDHKVPKVLRGHRASKARKVLPAHKVLRGLLVLKDRKVHQGHKDHRDRRGHPDLKDHKVLLDRRDLQELG